MSEIKITPGRCVAKISIHEYGKASFNKVIYYRSNLDIDLFLKYKWYFQYLAARVKVANPRMEVELYLGPQDTMKTGEQYRQWHTEQLLIAKKRKLTQLANHLPEDDLFGFGSEEHQRKIDKVNEDIEKLKNGTYEFYVFPESINLLKDYI